MTPVQRLNQRIAESRAKIVAIQEKCPHPAKGLTKTHHEDNGDGYGSSKTVYYTIYRCALCEKRWEEEGSR